MTRLEWSLSATTLAFPHCSQSPSYHLDSGRSRNHRKASRAPHQFFIDGEGAERSGVSWTVRIETPLRMADVLLIGGEDRNTPMTGKIDARDRGHTSQSTVNI